MASQTINGSQSSLSYNAANELTAAGSTTYSFDGNGNETGDSAGLSLSYNAQDQTTSATPPGGSAASYSYTDAGQTQRVRPEGQHACGCQMLAWREERLDARHDRRGGAHGNLLRNDG